ncbi:MAG: class I SAM-dependent methyltransferase [Acidobacteriaceae bacterium]
MAGSVVHRRGWQVLSWFLLAVFAAGFFYGPVGVWTGPILGAWLVCTQRVRRGFVWLLLLTFVPMLLSNLHRLPWTAPVQGLEMVGWMLAASVMVVLPFVFHRVVSPRLPFFETLPLPIAGVAVRMAALEWLPAQAVGFAFHGTEKNRVLAELSADFGTVAVTFATLWLAALVVWMWNREFRVPRFALGLAGFAAVFVGVVWEGEMRRARGLTATGATFAWICVGAVLALSVWASIEAVKERRSRSMQTETIAMLRSPSSGSALGLEKERGGETLVSAAGEKFPIRHGVPDFRTAQDLSGANGKYNRLYETIGGFYDDTQRVGMALAGMNRNAYMTSYLGKLELRPGDKVLETSVGTGLNFKYLPRAIRRYGLDLAWDMLATGQENFRRWGMDAELFLGNAERLPFADESFDVVFHTGGINFFSDRATAIREMIRVVRAGSLILIVDETEEHVKGAYENIPYTREFYKGRTEAVRAPVELVPAEMEEVRVESIFNGRLYALTFRKPRVGDATNAARLEHAAAV